MFASWDCSLQKAVLLNELLHMPCHWLAHSALAGKKFRNVLILRDYCFSKEMKICLIKHF